jgi:hypothetical protein
MTKFEILKPTLEAIKQHVNQIDREGYFDDIEIEVEIGDLRLYAYINYHIRLIMMEGSEPDDTWGESMVEHLQVTSVQMWGEGDGQLISTSQSAEMILSLNQALNAYYNL